MTVPRTHQAEEGRGTEFVAPIPCEGERPTDYADRVGKWCVSMKSAQYRKEHGIFLTPVAVAEFMAQRFKASGRRIRVLDPAAGAGILCCATVEALVSQRRKPDWIELVAHEVDDDLISALRMALDYLATWCRDCGVMLTVCIEETDFIMAHADSVRGGPLRLQSRSASFDAVICNPPYFKINKNDPRAIAVSDVVHGQPNIYALFMAVGAALLRKSGSLVFIVPRSFASGSYFRRFRAVFFDQVRPTRVHVFGSRREAFRQDEVLQENVIFCGIRQDHWHGCNGYEHLSISSSPGIECMDTASVRRVSVNTILDYLSADKVLRLPLCDDDDEALALVDSWPSSLRSLGLDVSTGPVVPFRATEIVAESGRVPATHAPLLWMNHVHAMQATWPLDRHKPEYIGRVGAKTLLVPNRNYVLLRRFSTKEETRRLTAAPWIAAGFAVPDLGLENHLNYIYRLDGVLSDDEAWGLAALFNSRLLDTWFRVVNGNTQVNATELRAMPLPAHHLIVALGQRVKYLAEPMVGLDTLVAGISVPQTSQEADVG